MRYVGICTEAISGPTEWGDGDVMGYLLVEVDGGWEGEASHYCSSPGYASADIERHYNKRSRVSEDDSYEWAGQLSGKEAHERFPAAAALEKETEQC